MIIRGTNFDLVPVIPKPPKGSGAGAALLGLLSEVPDGMVDQASALADAMRQAFDELTSDDEAPWRPWTTDCDEVTKPKADPMSRVRAEKMLRSIRSETSFLRSRFRNKFLEARVKREFHGVRRGVGLSERRIGDTWAEIQSGVVPTRPDYRTTVRDDVSLATAIVIDESGSMSHRVSDASRAMLAIVDPLDHLGCPTLAVGFRSTYNRPIHIDSGYYDETGNPKYHRCHAVAIDVFKDWNEKLRDTIGRFTGVRANGSTPMSDGVQFGLQSLSERKERHRIMFVITDGEPDHGHPKVIRKQIRIAREAGIEIIGIGIDHGCHSVGRVFDKFIEVHNVSQLPAELLKIVSDVVFPSAAKRVALDGNMKTKVA